MNQLRIGVIGAAGGRGSGWAKRVAKYSKKHKNIKLVALCDIRDTKRIQDLAAEFNVPIYQDYLEMYKNGNLDAVVIATPHYLHAKQTIAAAKNNIHIFVEKPMCINLEQADRMAAAVEKAGVKLAVGFQHRFNPIFTGMKKAIDSGDLGDIFQMNTFIRWYRKEDYYLNSTPAPDLDEDEEDWVGWRGHWRTEGGGALANQCVHFMDIFQWLNPSPIRSVTANSKINKHSFTETDDNTNAIIEFENGGLGCIIAGVAYEYGKDDEMGVYGTKGALVWRSHKYRRPSSFNIAYQDFRSKSVKKKKWAFKYMFPIRNPDKTGFMGWIKAIETGDSTLIACNVYDGRKSIEILRAILLSNLTGKKITFPFSDKPEDYPELERTYMDPSFA